MLIRRSLQPLSSAEWLEREDPQPAQEILRRNRLNALNQECAFGQKWHWNLDLELGATDSIGLASFSVRSGTPELVEQGQRAAAYLFWNWAKMRLASSNVSLEPISYHRPGTCQV